MCLFENFEIYGFRHYGVRVLWGINGFVEVGCLVIHGLV
jgi:hypothetical protein